jgi:hypothetical protein
MPKKVGGMGSTGADGEEISEDGVLDDARLDDTAFVLQAVQAEKTSISKTTGKRTEEFFIIKFLVILPRGG